jgi:three-Cys-motif partner protein
LKFKDGAICLSGAAGTGLKSKILGEYFPFWWRITSGGEKKDYQLPTAIIDLHAATGRVHIEDTGETLLGSAGHALHLKLDTPKANRLRIFLREEDPECFSLLRKFITDEWPNVHVASTESAVFGNSTQVFVSNEALEKTLDIVDKVESFQGLGRTIFLFDPLRSVPWASIEEVARRRIDSFYRKGTEFIIFLFTSDLFLGRDEFAALPTTPNESSWNERQRKSVMEADSLFGGTSWRASLLKDESVVERENRLVKMYKDALHKWFRYVLALPFAPKKEQVYQLFFCSNFEAGIRVTRNFYSGFTLNPRYSPDNRAAYERFKRQHPDKVRGYIGQRKPLEFKMLWKIIREHEDGFCDLDAEDLKEEEVDFSKRATALNWLLHQGYLIPVSFHNDRWLNTRSTYELDWGVVTSRLGVRPPLPLIPMSLSSTMAGETRTG